MSEKYNNKLHKFNYDEGKRQYKNLISIIIFTKTSDEGVTSGFNNITIKIFFTFYPSFSKLYPPIIIRDLHPSV